MPAQRSVATYRAPRRAGPRSTAGSYGCAAASAWTMKNQVVSFVSTGTPRVDTGGGWQGHRTEGVPVAHRRPRTPPDVAGGGSNVLVLANGATRHTSMNSASIGRRAAAAGSGRWVRRLPAADATFAADAGKLARRRSRTALRGCPPVLGPATAGP